MCRVIVIGSANMDFTVKLRRLPHMGETVSRGEFYTSFGGKGANQAVAAYKAGAEVRFLAKVGNDQNGESIIEHLESLGISCDIEGWTHCFFPTPNSPILERSGHGTLFCSPISTPTMGFNLFYFTHC